MYVQAGIGFIWQNNVQGESVQDSGKTGNYVRCRDVGSEESTREEVGCGGNEDVEMDLYNN